MTKAETNHAEQNAISWMDSIKEMVTAIDPESWDRLEELRDMDKEDMDKEDTLELAYLEAMAADPTHPKTNAPWTASPWNSATTARTSFLTRAPTTSIGRTNMLKEWNTYKCPRCGSEEVSVLAQVSVRPMEFGCEVTGDVILEGSDFTCCNECDWEGYKDTLILSPAKED